MRSQEETIALRIITQKRFNTKPKTGRGLLLKAQADADYKCVDVEQLETPLLKNTVFMKNLVYETCMQYNQRLHFNVTEKVTRVQNRDIKVVVGIM